MARNSEFLKEKCCDWQLVSGEKKELACMENQLGSERHAILIFIFHLSSIHLPFLSFILKVMKSLPRPVFIAFLWGLHQSSIVKRFSRSFQQRGCKLWNKKPICSILVSLYRRNAVLYCNFFSMNTLFTLICDVKLPILTNFVLNTTNCKSKNVYAAFWPLYAANMQHYAANFFLNEYPF